MLVPTSLSIRRGRKAYRVAVMDGQPRHIIGLSMDRRRIRTSSVRRLWPWPADRTNKPFSLGADDSAPKENAGTAVTVALSVTASSPAAT